VGGNRGLAILGNTLYIGTRPAIQSRWRRWSWRTRWWI